MLAQDHGGGLLRIVHRGGKARREAQVERGDARLGAGAEHLDEQACGDGAREHALPSRHAPVELLRRHGGELVVQVVAVAHDERELDEVHAQGAHHVQVHVRAGVDDDAARRVRRERLEALLEVHLQYLSHKLA